jgi:hypothetical protein
MKQGLTREQYIIESIQKIIDSLLELRSYLITEPIQNVDTEWVKHPPVKPRFDFESIYKLYPRKQGKLSGIKKCKSQIKTQTDYEDLQKAVQAFLKYHQRSSTLPEFIPYFSTFMSSWQEWLLPETGLVKLSPTVESTAEYMDRMERKRKAEEEEQIESDPARVRAIIDKALGRVPT